MIDLVGIDKLNSCFGFVMMADGIGMLIGPPVQGILLNNLEYIIPQENYMPLYFSTGV